MGYARGQPFAHDVCYIFINDLATSLKNLELGIEEGDRKVSILVYTDDVVLLMMRGKCKKS